MKPVQTILVGLLAIMLAGCSPDLLKGQMQTWHGNMKKPGIDEDLLKETKELAVWSYFDMSAIHEEFQQRYPGVRFSYKQFAYNQFEDAYIRALISGEPPDVLVIDNRYAGTFLAMRDAFDDLLEPPYSAMSYLRLIPGNLRNLYVSSDGGKLIGLPLDMTGAVMFYRKDLFEASGLPVEPEKLADYLREADHWMDAAQRLKQAGHVIFQQDTEPLDVLGMQETFFDEEFRYKRYTAAFSEMLEVSRTVWQQNLSLGSSVWTENGQQALRTGQLAAVYMGSWGIDHLQEWAPDTRGNWRATRLPMGVFGIEGGSFLAVPAKSKNKYLAWEYAKLATTIDRIPDYSSANDFLGGQDVSHLFRLVPYEAKSPTPSPFDAKAQQIWDTEMMNATMSATNIEEALYKVQAQIEAAVEEDRMHVLRYLGQRESLLP